MNPPASESAPLQLDDLAIPDGYLDEVVEPSAFVRVMLAIAHRTLSVGLLLLLIGIGAAVAGKGVSSVLLWAFVSGDAALLSGFFALAAERRRVRSGREARTIVWMSLAVIGLSLVTYFVSRKLRGI